MGEAGKTKSWVRMQESAARTGRGPNPWHRPQRFDPICRAELDKPTASTVEVMYFWIALPNDFFESKVLQRRYCPDKSKEICESREAVRVELEGHERREPGEQWAQELRHVWMRGKCHLGLLLCRL